MKSIKLVLLGFVLFFSLLTKAQVSVNVNIGTPPVWGPVGYAEARYYYIPDIETYYDINAGMFVYMGPRGWIHAKALPSMYAHFDLYNGYKVVLNFRGDNPYRYYEVHKTKFPKGYKNYKQKPFKMKHDNGNHYGHHKKGYPKSGNRIHFNDNFHGQNTTMAAVEKDMTTEKGTAKGNKFFINTSEARTLKPCFVFLTQNKTTNKSLNNKQLKQNLIFISEFNSRGKSFWHGS